MKAVRLGDIVLFVRNGKSVKQGSSQAGLPITRIETIADGEINPDKVGFADLGVEGNEEWLLKDGDILISHINSTKHLGKCAQYSGHPGQIIHGMNLLNLRCNQEKAFPRYVLHFLKSETFLRQIPRITKNSVNQSSFTVSAFKELVVYLPPLPEQKRIAAILDKADEIRRKREKAIELTDSFLRSVFLEMFGDPGANPKCLSTQPLGELSIFKGGGTPTTSEDRFWNGDIPWVSPKDMKSLFIADSIDKITPEAIAESATQLISGESVLVVTRSGILKKKLPLGINQRPVAINQDLKAIIPSGHLLPKFLLIQLTVLSPLILQTVRGTTADNISTEVLKSLRVLVPPLKDQRHFANIVDSHRKFVARLSASSSLISDLCGSLNNELLTYRDSAQSLKQVKTAQEAHAL
jgi:type I restriction enzyme S subunit